MPSIYGKQPGSNWTTEAANTPVPKVGQQYADLINANPYRNVEYKKSPFQNFLSALGFRTQADAWSENMAVQANEYDASILQKQYNEQYESPIAEASRMRQAGMNPDLQGIGDVEGAASPSDDPSTPMQSTGDEGQVYQFANWVMQSVSAGLALAKDFGSLASVFTGIQGDRISNVEKVGQFANWVGHQFALNPLDEDEMAYDPSTGEEMPAKLANALDLTDQYERQLPRRFRRQFRKNLASTLFSFGVKGERYAKALQIAKDRKELALIRGSKYYSDDDTALSAVIKPLVELSDKVAESSLKMQNVVNEQKTVEANKAKQYAESFNAVAAANAANQMNLDDAQNSQINREINSAMKDIVHDLKAMADKGNIFAQSMLLSFSLSRMVNVSVGPKGAKIGFSPQ